MSRIKMQDCVVCGRPTHTTHHLIFGNSRRPICDKDGIVMALCENCHTAGRYRLHDNPVAEHLSKMLGQALCEKQYILENYGEGVETEAREVFRSKYGKSWL